MDTAQATTGMTMRRLSALTATIRIIPMIARPTVTTGRIGLLAASLSALVPGSMDAAGIGAAAGVDVVGAGEVGAAGAGMAEVAGTVAAVSRDAAILTAASVARTGSTVLADSAAQAAADFTAVVVSMEVEGFTAAEASTVAAEDTVADTAN